MLGGSRTKPPVAGIHRFSSTLQPDTNASHLRVGIVSKRRQAPVPFSLLVSLPSRLSAIFPSIPAIYSRESTRFRVSPRIFHRSNREWRSRRKIILSSVKFLNFRIERQVKVEFFLSFSLSSSRFLFNHRVNYHRLIFLDEFLPEISVHDLLAKVSRSLQMNKTYKYTVFGGSKIQ